ncbi:LysM peptidoglycan-binding domain-containing protein [Desulfotomaculum copahuensis]|uniref:LysM peptidoglycan-binding domain-containing protein n=1 Tax=Desulfotomaculum copahuensis TaxID=1838280 RepID=UPI0013726F6F|nr:M23 family metallopeptidase [Desulfotomaculum copahuensis]
MRKKLVLTVTVIALGLLLSGGPLLASPDEAVREDVPYSENLPSGSGSSVGGHTAAAYTVQPGDCLLSIAGRFNVDQDALCKANRIGDQSLLQPGQLLTIPGAVAYQVAAGETLDGIASQYGVSAQELIGANDIRTPGLITAGETLLIPSGGQNVLPAWDGGGLAWPLPGCGDITSPFGWRQIFGRREFHQGIDIGCPAGTTVDSASAGRVTWAGWENPADRRQGYGYYLVVRDNTKLYYYGHLSPDSNLVKVGDSVQPGQPIAKSGDTGDATGPHLHFGIESLNVAGRGGDWVNPLAAVSPQSTGNVACAAQ